MAYLTWKQLTMKQVLHSSFLTSVLPYSDPFSIFVNAIILQSPKYAAIKKNYKHNCDDNYKAGIEVQ